MILCFELILSDGGGIAMSRRVRQEDGRKVRPISMYQLDRASQESKESSRRIWLTGRHFKL